MSKASYGEFGSQMSYAFLDTHADPGAIETGIAGPYRRWGKRGLDIFLVLAILPVALPIVMIAVLLSKRDGGSGFFCQPRVGQNGRVFECWKIRTMLPDADRVLARLIVDDPVIAKEWLTDQKLANDPRVTRFGRLLRMTSIDELPQLWNVLVGDMSIIGPRPFTPDQKTLYDSLSPFPSYYQMRPGISGLWQVEARNNSAFIDRHHFDEKYSASLTFMHDFRIAIKTVRVIAGATGK